ncbi:hypothetical protein CI610_00673 [invertebrate metagenome]|uniref:EamA domain-containing protein n=1 Tax=invertebrate metagenome TaxID=1711999 RepID=A0A2H9TAS3_9ZZZZ
MSSTSLPLSGFGNSIAASILFGLTPWYIQLLAPVNGNLLFFNRVIFSGLAVLLIILSTHQIKPFLAIFTRPSSFFLMVLCALLIGIQWWLFVWAPINNYTKELSMGYYLLPLTLTLTGRIFFKERLTSLQKWASFLVAAGLGYDIIMTQQLSPVTIAVAGLYPLYFVARRLSKVDTIPGFLFENLLYAPFALYLLSSDSMFSSQLISNHTLWYLLPGLGVLCAISMLFYVNASRVLPISLFGLLSYLEPTVIFFVAVFILNEPFPQEQWVIYLSIWLAAALVSIDSLKLFRKRTPMTA